MHFRSSLVRSSTALALVGALAGSLGACREKVDPRDPATQSRTDGRACPPATGMISDGESLNKTNFIAGRGGYWYTFLDTKDNGGSDVWPLSARAAARRAGSRTPITRLKTASAPGTAASQNTVRSGIASQSISAKAISGPRTPPAWSAAR